MQRIRTEILPGVWLTALRTEKFKTAWLSVNLLTQLRRETAACTAVLPYVLPARLHAPARSGGDRSRARRALRRAHHAGRAQAGRNSGPWASRPILPTTAHSARKFFPGLPARCGRPAAAPEHARRPAAADIVDSERTQLIARIRAAVNNKRSYARERLYTHMCCCEDFAVPRLVRRRTPSASTTAS